MYVCPGYACMFEWICMGVGGAGKWWHWGSWVSYTYACGMETHAYVEQAEYDSFVWRVEILKWGYVRSYDLLWTIFNSGVYDYCFSCRGQCGCGLACAPPLVVQYPSNHPLVVCRESDYPSSSSCYLLNFDVQLCALLMELVSMSSSPLLVTCWNDEL